jgi:hypothetical protein
MNINKKDYVYVYVSSSGRDHDMKIYRPGNWVDREDMYGKKERTVGTVTLRGKEGGDVSAQPYTGVSELVHSDCACAVSKTSLETWKT